MGVGVTVGVAVGVCITVAVGVGVLFFTCPGGSGGRAATATSNTAGIRIVMKYLLSMSVMSFTG